MAYSKPPPFTDRANVFEVSERIGPDGEIITPIDAVDVRQIIDTIIRTTKPDSIAICLLHAYANATHEQFIGRFIAEHHPTLKVVLSSDVCPVHREFERASTTVINAFLQPVVDDYLARFEAVVGASGCIASPLIMQANGGVLPVSATRERPAGLYLSGPSAAVAGAASLAQRADLPSLITLDVGGTSTDICLVTDGEVHETGHGGAYGTVQGQPLNMVMTDIVTIGAGGGSLAWVDAGGMLRVGPQSAGATPGPACYDRGGEGFTLTDAMLCLGLLADGAELPGRIVLALDAALRAAEPLCQELGLEPMPLADAVYRVAIANMAEAIRAVTLRRGYDPREYALLACGGAGPMVGCALAEELEVRRVLVPREPGVFSAFGLSAAGLRMDFARAVEQNSAASEDARAMSEMLDALKQDAFSAFASLGVADASLDLSFTADVRYAGQGFELRVPFEAEQVQARGPAHIEDCFHEVHAHRYGHSFNTQRVEITALRLNARSPSADRAQMTLADATPCASKDAAAPIASLARSLQLGGVTHEARIFERDASLLAPGAKSIAGPALCVEPTTTTLVLPNWQIQTGSLGLLHLTQYPLSEAE